MVVALGAGKDCKDDNGRDTAPTFLGVKVLTLASVKGKPTQGGPTASSGRRKCATTSISAV